jgi:mRNA interferase YafQ
MMRLVRRSSQFKRDVKRQVKRGKKLSTLMFVVKLLAESRTMPDRYRDHSLLGGYRGTRECHIEPDWLLIYEVSDEELVLIRTGSHADLFE